MQVMSKIIDDPHHTNEKNNAIQLSLIPDWIQSLIHQWHQRMYVLNRSDQTIVAYMTDVQVFFTFICTHGTPLDSLDHLQNIPLNDLRSYVSHRHSMGIMPRSVKRAISSIRSFFTFLIQEKKIEKNPLTFLKSPKLKKTLPRPLKPQDTTNMIDNIHLLSNDEWVGLRNKAFIILLYGTGMRISEALSLKYNDIHNKTQFYVLGKRNKERLIPLLPIVREAIEKYVSACPHSIHDDDFIFKGKGGKQLNANIIQKIIRDYRRLENLSESVTPHALRHTCATHLIQQKPDLRTIQELLGHASLSSTQIYMELDDQKLMDAIKSFHPRYKKV
jgi:integrase/recombinase XerC